MSSGGVTGPKNPLGAWKGGAMRRLVLGLFALSLAACATGTPEAGTEVVVPPLPPTSRHFRLYRMTTPRCPYKVVGPVRVRTASVSAFWAAARATGAHAVIGIHEAGGAMVGQAIQFTNADCMR